MSALNQKTIKNEILIEGIGLHTGKVAYMKIIPAEPNNASFLLLNNLWNVTKAPYLDHGLQF